MTETNDRSVLTARLRAMADWLDASPGIPLSPYISVVINQFATMDEAREARSSAPGGWVKDNNAASSWVTYHHDASPGPDADAVAVKWQVRYSLNVSKADTCERVQIGSRHVEEHDEPVYEWKCDA
jgi:hypothetical protein